MGTPTLDVQRSVFAQYLVKNYLVDTQHKPHPYIIRVNLIPDFSRLGGRPVTCFERKTLRNVGAYHLFFVTQVLRQICTLNPELPWRPFWYSVGVSLHTKQVYGLLAFRHVDPLRDILLQGH